MHSCNIKPCLAFTTVYHPIPPSRLDISMVKYAQITTDTTYVHPAPYFHEPQQFLINLVHMIFYNILTLQTNTCQLLYSLHNYNVAHVFTLNVEFMHITYHLSISHLMLLLLEFRILLAIVDNCIRKN